MQKSNKDFTINEIVILAFINILIGTILIITYFLSSCLTIFTFGMGLFLLTFGIAMADVEYHEQTHWIMQRMHTK